MEEKKPKKDLTRHTELKMDDIGFILEPTQIEVGSGYTVSVSYNKDEKPIVNIKTYGEVNMAKIQKEIKKAFPDAEIRNLNAGTVTIVKKLKTSNKQHK